MNTLTYCAKQATAMAEFQNDRAKARLDDAIDREESRDELIAARTQELIVKRMAEMAPIDVVAGMQSVIEGGAGKLIAERILANDPQTVGVYVIGLVKAYIADDCETQAHEWIEKVERELADWSH